MCSESPPLQAPARLPSASGRMTGRAPQAVLRDVTAVGTRGRPSRPCPQASPGRGRGRQPWAAMDFGKGSKTTAAPLRKTKLQFGQRNDHSGGSGSIGAEIEGSGSFESVTLQRLKAWAYREYWTASRCWYYRQRNSKSKYYAADRTYQDDD